MVGNLQKFPKRSLRNMFAGFIFFKKILEKYGWKFTEISKKIFKKYDGNFILFLIFKNILEKYGWKFIEISKNIFEKYGGKFLENFPKDP